MIWVHSWVLELDIQGADTTLEVADIGFRFWGSGSVAWRRAASRTLAVLFVCRSGRRAWGFGTLY